MHAAFDGVDVVGVGVDLFEGVVGVLEGHFHVDAVALPVEIDHIGGDQSPVVGEGLDELPDAAFVMENFGPGGAALLFAAFVGEGDLDAGVQISQFPEPFHQGRVGVGGHGEDGAVGLEGDSGAPLGGFSDLLEGFGGDAPFEADLVDLAVPVDLDFHPVRKGVDAGNAHAVESAGNLVGVVVEFAARVEHGEHHLNGGFLLGLVHIHRDAPAVILHGNGVVGADDHLHVVGETGQSLVDGVVHHLVDQMMEPPLPGIADIHGRTDADRLQAFEDRDFTCAVIRSVVILHTNRFVAHEKHLTVNIGTFIINIALKRPECKRRKAKKTK